MDEDKQGTGDSVCEAPPQLTFTEEEHRTLVDYLNFVDKNARFKDLSQREIHACNQLYAKTVQVVKKIEAHIFEFKRVVNRGVQ